MPRIAHLMLFCSMLIIIPLHSLYAVEATFSIKGGGSTYFGEIHDQKITPYSALSLDLWFHRAFGLQAAVLYGRLKAEKNNEYFETELEGVAGFAKLRPFQKSVFSPYIMGGVEYFRFNPTNKLGYPLPNNAADVYKKDRVGVPVGGGFSIFLSEKISVDLEGQYHFSLTDYLDDISRDNIKDTYVSVSLGLSLHLGKDKDTDGDGIPDRSDADPLRPEDFDGYQDLDGAPDLDNDMDGVPDTQDGAPMQPEDRDGFEDQDGVPDPDNDGDGILDVNDAAPNEKEDFDSFEDEDGAPDRDNDEDTILDENDECPGTDQTVADGTDTRETFNGYEDQDGCPDKKPEIAVEKGESIVLEGIYFATGSAALTPNSQVILDKAFRTLRDNPKIEVEIRGHTDITGSYQTNMRLSQQRADAVKLYLINKGIDAARVRTKGYGPDQPIAPNSTREGRAKNRRIEFYRIK